MEITSKTSLKLNIPDPILAKNTITYTLFLFKNKTPLKTY